MSADTEMAVPSSIQELEPRMELRGKVTRLELYGAFVDIGVGKDALLHISQLGRSNVRNVEDVVKPGDEVTVYVLKVDKADGKVAVSLAKPPAMTWDELKENTVVTGKVVRLEDFGVFIDIGAERPGMVHVSELTSGFVKSPSEVVSVGDEVQARIIRINRKKRQIDMSMKAVEEPVAVMADDEDDEEMPTAMELALRKAMEQREEGSSAVRRKNKQKGSREQDDIIARTLRSQMTDNN